MLVSLKNVSNNIYIYNVNKEDMLSSIIPKLFNSANIDPINNTIKFIFKGQNLNYDKLFGEFNVDTLEIYYVIIKNKTEYIDEYKISLDNVDILRSSLMGSLYFIRYNTQFMELFNNNFDILIDLIASNKFKPFFEKMINETKIGDSKYLDEITEILLNSKIDNNLTSDDDNNINTIVKYGYNKQSVTNIYKLCNKNIDMSLSILMKN